MNSTEAQFILQARRPNGHDDADPQVAAALAQARHDPVLAAWLAKQQAFDASIAAQLRTLAPPAEPRAAILSGARVNRPVPFWRTPAMLGLAASGVLILGVVAGWPHLRPAAAGDQLALGVMQEVDAVAHHAAFPQARGALRTALTDPALRLAAGLALDFDQLKRDGCRSLRIADREVVEVCFERGGWFHLYVGRREDFGGKNVPAVPLFREQGALAAVAWTDARHAYVLVSGDGAAALRNVF